jgi:RecB family exonuclease
VLARFTGEFQQFLEEHGWDHDQAQEVLQGAALQVLGELLEDLHWQAEWARWLGGEEGGPSLLKEWLRREKEKYDQGWRWRLIEAEFAGLKQAGWPFALRGRLDRLDYHPERREAVVWDYKSGKVPKAAEVFDALQEIQLACYLLAVDSGLTGGPRDYERLRAGFIGLKSLRKDDLKHEDFGKRAGEWPRVVEALGERLKELGRRLAAEDFRPNPTPAPEGDKLGACQFCPYALLCGFSHAARPEAEEDESE